MKLGKGTSRMLTDGAEVAFGSTSSSPGNPYEDYRMFLKAYFSSQYRTTCFSGFIFRHTASGKNPETGFYALYDLGNQLGRGSFASVVHCMDRATGVFWAAKIFSNTIGIGDGSLSSRTDKMVSREISILQKLRHPNICFLKDTFILEDGKLSRTRSLYFWDHSDDVSTVLVLELIEGGDLLEHILSHSGTGEHSTASSATVFGICSLQMKT